MAHCPRCGRTLDVQVDGRLRCAAGEMPLSRQLTNELWRFVGGEEIETTPIMIPIGGVWHCPTDGAVLDEKGSRLYCAVCARHFPARFWFQLVESHHHS